MTREEQIRNKRADSIRRHIYSDLTLTGTKTEVVYTAMGMSKANWFLRMKDPDMFRASEIRTLRRFVSKETADMITE